MLGRGGQDGHACGGRTELPQGGAVRERLLACAACAERARLIVAMVTGYLRVPPRQVSALPQRRAK